MQLALRIHSILREDIRLKEREEGVEKEENVMPIIVSIFFKLAFKLLVL